MDKKDIAFLLALVVAICGAVYKFGKLEGRLSTSGIDKEIVAFEKRVGGIINEANTELASVLKLVPVGTIVAYSGDLANVNSKRWLPCDGRVLSSSEYPELNAVVGNSWGGDGKGAFYLPDLRGRFVRGVDAGAGRDTDAFSRNEPAIGGNKGDEVGSVQEFATALPVGKINQFRTSDDSGQHYHTLGRVEQGYKHSGGSGDPIVPHDAVHERNIARTGLEKGKDDFTRRGDDGGHSHIINNGGNLETRPRNANVYWLIKVM